MLREEEQGLSWTDVHMKSTSCSVNGEKILKTFKPHVGALWSSTTTHSAQKSFTKKRD
jgi:hypothetical protein